MPLHIGSSSDGELTNDDSDPIEIGVEDVCRSIVILDYGAHTNYGFHSNIRYNSHAVMYW